MGKRSKPISKTEKTILAQAFSVMGKISARKLTKEQRKERARLAGIASGKARKKKTEQ